MEVAENLGLSFRDVRLIEHSKSDNNPAIWIRNGALLLRLGGGLSAAIRHDRVGIFLSPMDKHNLVQDMPEFLNTPGSSRLLRPQPRKTLGRIVGDLPHPSPRVLSPSVKAIKSIWRAMKQSVDPSNSLNASMNSTSSLPRSSKFIPGINNNLNNINDHYTYNLKGDMDKKKHIFNDLNKSKKISNQSSIQTSTSSTGNRQYPLYAYDEDETLGLGILNPHDSNGSTAAKLDGSVDHALMHDDEFFLPSAYTLLQPPSIFQHASASPSLFNFETNSPSILTAERINLTEDTDNNTFINNKSSSIDQNIVNNHYKNEETHLKVNNLIPAHPISILQVQQDEPNFQFNDTEFYNQSNGSSPLTNSSIYNLHRSVKRQAIFRPPPPPLPPPPVEELRAMPFEHVVLDRLLHFAVASFSSKSDTLDLEVHALVDRLESPSLRTANVWSDALRLKTRIQEVESGVSGLIEALRIILDDESEMKALHLSALEKIESNRNLDSELGASDENGVSDASDIDVEDTELMLEIHLQAIEEVSSDLASLRTLLENHEVAARMRLDSTRNVMMELDLRINATTMVIAFSTFAAGLFGMNLKSHFEEDDYAFAAVSGCCMLIGLSLHFLIFWKFQKWQVITPASHNFFGKSPFS